MHLRPILSRWSRLPLFPRRLLRFAYRFFRLRYWQSDRTAILRAWRRYYGIFPDLENPVTLTEKIAWRMLHDRNPLFAVCSDKYAVRQWVTAKGAGPYLVPLLQVTDRAERLDFASLPQQFVVKASHGCKWNELVWDKNRADRERIIEKAGSWLRSDYYRVLRERQYKRMQPRILVEEMVADDAGSPDEYKLACFDGRPEFFEVVHGRFTSQFTVDYYNADWQHLPVSHKALANGGPEPRPPELEEMLQLARLLSAGFDFVRVDLYRAKGRVWFNELTFTPGAGLMTYHPPEYDEIFGRMWRLRAAS